MAKEVVGEMIEDWVNEHPSRSLMKLQELSGVSDTTLRRIKDGAQSPGFETIMSIGRATKNAVKWKEAIARYYPDNLAFVSEGALSEAALGEMKDPMGFLESPDSTRIFVALFTRKGLDREYVEKRFGENGSAVLNALKKMGFAESADDRFFKSPANMFAYRNASEVLRVIQMLALSFERTELGGSYARAVTMAESVSEDAAKKMKVVLENAAIELKKIIEDPKSAGDTVVAASLLMQPIK